MVPHLCSCSVVVGVRWWSGGCLLSWVVTSGGVTPGGPVLEGFGGGGSCGGR